MDNYLFISRHKQNSLKKSNVKMTPLTSVILRVSEEKIFLVEMKSTVKTSSVFFHT